MKSHLLCQPPKPARIRSKKPPKPQRAYVVVFGNISKNDAFRSFLDIMRAKSTGKSPVLNILNGILFRPIRIKSLTKKKLTFKRNYRLRIYYLNTPENREALIQKVRKIKAENPEHFWLGEEFDYINYQPGRAGGRKPDKA